ncbi:pyridoxal-dependent decarboxylase, exosortase A system-associated [Pacificimonas sp. WHA3]|uniref:Pyridoxal-dependent decarboxylase, exosortase A system-associated n=1 Tax=Pacificimonas pallii TaxID=2827236 RepID=A0ABS6SFC9_9SPHN|nr:pyridoxal-dependent decarboxylase, exosortase A system-associated [Pacificimonas pallii]MBV7257114.1 pyridoxal-dependent decarboxylase, exosortase A system-associated [Pacificimonas pallii]
MHDPRISGLFAAADDGELLIGGERASDLVERAGDTPLFVYDRSVIDRQIAALRQAMPRGVELHFAVKANPYQPVIDHIAGQVDGLDIASAGELEFALASGCDPGEISFAGPGKRDRELDAAIRAGVTLNCESAGELRRTLTIAEMLGETPRIALRVNPTFDLKGSGMRMGGGAKPFGVDTDQVPALLRRIGEAGADFRGFHIFAGSQNLKPDAIIEAQAQTVALVAELAAHAPAPPPTANIGGGFGLPYFPGDVPLDLEPIGAALAETLANRPAILKDTRFILELGRYIVGTSGVYLTRIVDRKESDGQTFLVTDGGLHHQLAASGNFGTVIRRNYPLVHAGRANHPPEETVNVVGCLCTPLDKLGDKNDLPKADVGDLIAVFMAGAYGRSASPERFLGHPSPIELLV